MVDLSLVSSLLTGNFFVMFKALTTQGHVFENIRCLMTVRRATSGESVETDEITLRECGNDEIKLPFIQLGISSIVDGVMTPSRHWSKPPESESPIHAN